MIDAAAIAGALSRYRLIRRLGGGGMGEVYLAADDRLGRQVALKVLPPEACTDPQLRLRFKQEARAAAMLSHPSICTVYDVDETPDGRIFITMEYVDGATLSESGSGRELSLDQLLDIAIQAAEAVEEAHGRGVIHRDLKPGNLMLTPRGRLKVVDFGLAKLSASPTETEESPTGLRTSPGLVVGTVAYMSPEQAFALDVDHRSDIFSFGIVLYQLVSGEKPFSGRSQIEIIDRIAHDDPPPLDRARAPEELERVIRKCLEKNRDHRYQSMTDVLVDLRAMQRTSRSTSVAVRRELPLSALPPEISSFLGRTAEIEELRSLMGQHRLITITGAAGCGKSRLAIETARTSGQSGGYLDLGGIDVPDRVPSMIAESLGLKDDRPGTETAGRNVGEREILLLIDNCEHLIDAVAAAVGDLLRTAPRLKILCTSREPLNISGECTWSLPPLAVPPASFRPVAESALSFDSVALFVDRARSASPRFVLADSTAVAVVDICRAVDGVPLAIELAAARVRAMSPAEIAKRLDDAFRLFGSQARGGRQRQQTLRAALDWSYDLLADPEKRAFQRLSVFRGGFDLEAAESIIAFDVIAEDEVIELLARLVERSLVLAERRGDDSLRYRLLEPLRQYGREKLHSSGDSEETQKRHVSHFAALAERAYDERVSSSGAWLERLEAEHDNLRAALTWTAAHDRVRELRLAGALGWFWYSHSHFTEGRERLRHALAGTSARDRETARALGALSMLGNWQSDTESRDLAEQSLGIWREIGDDIEAALALEAIGWSIWIGLHDDDAALARFEEAMKIHQRSGDERLINRTRLAMCQVLVSQGNIARARPLSQQALNLATSHGDQRDIHNGYHFLADCALIEGDVVEAERLYRSSLRLTIAYGDRSESTWEVEGVAMALAGQKRYQEALRLAGAVDAERQALNLTASVRFWDELVERYIAAADHAMGADSARLRIEGARMGFEAACDQALSVRAG